MGSTFGAAFQRLGSWLEERLERILDPAFNMEE